MPNITNIYKKRFFPQFPKTTHLIVAGFNHQQRRFVLFHTNVERGQRASVLLGRVQQNRLVHCNSHGQPRPEREQLFLGEEGVSSRK